MKGNNAIQRNHFRKEWQLRVKTWFNQPAKKKARRVARLQKAAAIFPRPTEALRPVVRPSTVKHNFKTRIGRGFTSDELKAAQISRKVAPTIGIAVDHRRRNHSEEAFRLNVNRLKQYKNKMILFPLNPKKPHKKDATAEQQKAAVQLKSQPLPNVGKAPLEPPRAITDAERKFSAFRKIKQARRNARLVGIREKNKKAKAESKKDGGKEGGADA